MCESTNTCIISDTRDYNPWVSLLSGIGLKIKQTNPLKLKRSVSVQMTSWYKLNCLKRCKIRPAHGKTEICSLIAKGVDNLLKEWDVAPETYISVNTHTRQPSLFSPCLSFPLFFMVRISEAGKEWFIPATNRWRESREAEWLKISAGFRNQLFLVSLSQTQPYLN